MSRNVGSPLLGAKHTVAFGVSERSALDLIIRLSHVDIPDGLQRILEIEYKPERVAEMIGELRRGSGGIGLGAGRAEYWESLAQAHRCIARFAVDCS